MKQEKLVQVRRFDEASSHMVIELEREGHKGEKRTIAVDVLFEEYVSQPITKEVAEEILKALGDRGELVVEKQESGSNDSSKDKEEK